jgi:hypothetical protein
MQTNGPRITADSRLVASGEQVSCDAGRETVILNLRDAVYYGLDSTATRIWELFRQPSTVSEVCDVLVSEYDVDETCCLADTTDLCQQLVQWRLLDFSDVPTKPRSHEIPSEVTNSL